MDQVIICRLCLNLLQPKEAVALFNSNGPTLMGTMVQAIYPIKLTEGDGPNSTCSECLVKVGNSYKLYKQVVRCQAQISTYWPSIPDILDSVGNFPDPVLPTPNGNEPSKTVQSKQEKKALQYPKHIQSEIKRQFNQSNNDMDISSGWDSVEETATPLNETRNLDSEDSLVENESSPFRQLRVKRKRISYIDNDNTLRYQCEHCGKGFDKSRSYHLHKRIHKVPILPAILPITAPFQQPKLLSNIDLKQPILFSCELCQKKFKYQIQLKRHIHYCAASTNDAFDNLDGEEQCPFCKGKFNTTMNLKKHIRDAHAGSPSPSAKVESLSLPKATYEWVACNFCKEETFNSYKIFTNHFNQCPKRTNLEFLSCELCNVQYSSKTSFFSHMRRKHFEAAQELATRSPELVEQPLHETDGEENEEESDGEQFECPVCFVGFSRQDQLVEHLTVHMREAGDGLNSCKLNMAPRPTTSNTNEPTVKCLHCDRVFINKRALNTHVQRQHSNKKVTPNSGKCGKSKASSDSEEFDTTCDICDKIFSYKRTLLIHKKNKHRGVAGKITTVQFRKCRMRCLICNFEMSVEESFDHIKEHSVSSIKGMLEYQCRGCGAIFRTTQGLRDHIHTEHRRRKEVGSIAERTDDARNEYIGHTIGAEFSKDVFASIKTEIIEIDKCSPVASASHNKSTRAQSKSVPEQANTTLEEENISETADKSPHKPEADPNENHEGKKSPVVVNESTPQSEADSSQGNVVTCIPEEQESIQKIESSSSEPRNSLEEPPNGSPEENSELVQTNNSLEQENSVMEQTNYLSKRENSLQNEESNIDPDQGNSSLEESNKGTEQTKSTPNQICTKSVNVARKKTTQIPANMIEDTSMGLEEENITEGTCEAVPHFSDEDVMAIIKEASKMNEDSATEQSETTHSQNNSVKEEKVNTPNQTKQNDVNEISITTITKPGNVARKKTTQIPSRDIEDLNNAMSDEEQINKTLVEHEIAGTEEENGVLDEDWASDEENMSSSEENKSVDEAEPATENNEELGSPNKVPRVCLGGFTCPQCGKTIDNVRSFRSHINWHATRGKTMEKKIECKICQEVFIYSTHYRIHMKSHWSDPNLDPKFLTCRTCGKLSATLRCAQTHERVHSNRYPSRPHHTCGQCGKNFQFRKYYLTHMLTHHDEDNGGR